MVRFRCIQQEYDYDLGRTNTITRTISIHELFLTRSIRRATETGNDLIMRNFISSP